ncbi:hypothetical protein D3C83_87140 [compost metagenome]
MLDAPAAPGRFEGTQLARAHGIDEHPVKVRSGTFDNLKADHASAPPLAAVIYEMRVGVGFYGQAMADGKHEFALTLVLHRMRS